MPTSAQKDKERAEWQLNLLRACIASEAVQALPIQDRRGKVIEGLRASLRYFRQLGKQFETWNAHELCLLVERSTTVKIALDHLKQRILAESTNHAGTPASNTGVTDTAHSALTDYVAGRIS